MKPSVPVLWLNCVRSSYLRDLVAYKCVTLLPYKVSSLLSQLICMFYIFSCDRTLIKINEGNHVGDTL